MLKIESLTFQLISEVHWKFQENQLINKKNRVCDQKFEHREIVFTLYLPNGMANFEIFAASRHSDMTGPAC